MGDWTCLHSACRYGHRDIVGDLIVKYKCDKEKVKKVYNVILKLCVLTNTVVYTHIGYEWVLCVSLGTNSTHVYNEFLFFWPQFIFKEYICSGLTSLAD